MDCAKTLLFRLGLILACLAGFARAEESVAPARDTLVYKDGDRVQGRFVEQTGDILVFDSDRFGRLQVPVDRAVVIKAEKPAPPAVAAAPALPAAPAVQAAAVKAKAAEHAEAERVSQWELFSPAVLAAKLRTVFGPWHGRVAFSTEVVSDRVDRTNLSGEIQLKRKWKSDEVQLNGSQDYSETSGLTTTDRIKANGHWRHDFSKNSFVQYRPVVEWNRASFRAGLPADYVLLQQEIGAGLNLLTKPARKLRVGLSENLFDVWTTSPPATHTSRTAESIFVEAELRVPWGIKLTDRGVYYYSLSSRFDGWENRAELSKKFTESLSASILHELRRGSPDGTAQDYTRLKLLLGLDF